MKVLSLFDGMACGALALQAAGVEIESYDAFEIDKYAVQTSSHNFPFIKHHGDVFKADFTEFEGVDLVCGGSPCTYWSIAQKNNRETEASGLGWELFQQYVRAVKEAKPRFFIYENNKSMSKAIRASIDEAFGFEAVLINSALVSAQNRQRLYWVSRRNADGTYSKVNVEQPEDRGIVLRDILETGVNLTSNEKSYALTTRCNGAIPEDTISRRRHTMVAEPINTTDNGDKARTLMAGYYKYGTATLITNEGFKGGTTAVAELARVPDYGVSKKSRPLSASYSHKGSGEGSLLSDAFPDNPNKQVFDYVAESINTTKEDMGKDSKAMKQVYEVKGGYITIKDKKYPIKLADGFYIIRKLTVRECMRLQTVPEWYEFPVSNSQAYKMLGNGWTVEVIAHLITSILKEM